MAFSSWHLHGQQARLSAERLSAALEVSRPHQGVGDLSAHGAALPGMRLFQTYTLGEETPAQAAEDVHDCYVRGDDLVATYRESAARPVRPQVYWRALRLGQDDAEAFGLELILSMQTSLLDSDPGLLCKSVIPAHSVRQLIDVQTPRYITHSPEGQAIEAGSAAGQGVHLFTLSNAPWTYAQMTLPADFSFAEARQEQGQFSLSQRLFRERLEKGVIRRVRVRGLFLPQDNDEPLAARLYQQWMDEAPPLTV